MISNFVAIVGHSFYKLFLTENTPPNDEERQLYILLHGNV